MDRILKQALKRITPTPKEKRQIEEITQKVLRTAEVILKPHGIDVTLAGSFIRDTWMKDKKEFDVFMLFPESTPRQELEALGLEYGIKIVKRLKGSYKIAYAEHPYVRARVLGFDIDLVPCYKLKSAEKIKSAVDRTPFHNQWLLENLKPELRGDVRLLKQFAKANRLYGSDLVVQGFSGYLCELLIINYRGFKNWIRAASGWEPGRVVIDPGKHYPDIQKALKLFPKHPLIVIDPVDPKRNVAAVLSCRNFIRTVSLAKAFLEKPSLRFFFRPKPRIRQEKLKRLVLERKSQLLFISFKKPDIVPDVLVPQLRRAARRLVDILKEYEFQVLGWQVWFDQDIGILLELETWELPAVRKIIGPPIFILDRSQEFLKKYRPLGRIEVEGENWIAEIKRRFREAEKKLEDSLKDREEELLAKGIPSHIAKSISKGFRILTPKDILRKARRDEKFREWLFDYLTSDALAF